MSVRFVGRTFAVRMLLKNSRFTTDLIYLGVRQFGIKCLALLAMTFALRKLGPAGLGQAGVAFGLVNVLGILTQLGIDALLPKEVAENPDARSRARIASELYSLRITLQVLSWPLFAIGACWEMQRGESGSGEVMTLLIWISAYAYLLGNGCSPQLWMQGIDNLRRLGDRQLLVSFVTASLLMICFFWAPAAAALMFIQALGLLLLAHLIFKEYGLEQNIVARLSVLKKLGAHLRMSWPLIMNAVVAYVYGSFDVLVVATLPSHEQIGQYTAAVTLSNGANAFLGLIPLALYPRLLEWVRRSRTMAYRRVALMAAFMLVLAAPMFFVLHSLCRTIIPLILGDHYMQTASIFTAIFVQYSLYIGIFAVTSLFIAIGSTKKAMIISLVGALSALPAYIFSAHLGGSIYLSYGKVWVYAGMLILALGFLVHLILQKHLGGEEAGCGVIAGLENGKPMADGGTLS